MLQLYLLHLILLSQQDAQEISCQKEKVQEHNNDLFSFHSGMV